MKLHDSKVVVSGIAKGNALVSDMPLSFWGGVDVKSGEIIDVYHSLNGECVTNQVLCIPYDRGSCSGSGIMLEMIRQNSAPAAIICLEAEPVLTLGSVMGNKIYGHGVVIHTVSKEVFKSIKHGTKIFIDDSGIRVEN